MAQTRSALLAAGLRPGSVEGPRGALRYFEGGEGKTVVLLHGSGSQAGDWQGVVPALVRHHHLLVLDLPGHGESGPAEGALPVGISRTASALSSTLGARASRPS